MTYLCVTRTPPLPATIPWLRPLHSPTARSDDLPVCLPQIVRLVQLTAVHEQAASRTLASTDCPHQQLMLPELLHLLVQAEQQGEHCYLGPPLPSQLTPCDQDLVNQRKRRKAERQT